MPAHLAKGFHTSGSADLQLQPNHVPRPNALPSSKSVVDYPLHIEGTARLYTCNLPMDTFVDFSNPKDHQSYTYCWINGDRGAGGHISFPTPGTCGEFKVDLSVRQGDPDLLKTQVSMHFRDENTKNFRTSTLAVSVVDLCKLLEGGEDRVVMYDQFVQGNFCDLTFRLTNASDYANYKGDSGVGRSVSTRPKSFLNLKPSALRGLKDINEQVNSVSQHFVDAMGQNNVAMAKGGEPFYRGVTSREFGGRKDPQTNVELIPPLLSHYAIMNAQEECLDRYIPLAVVVYHACLMIHHTGLTAESVLKLDDTRFGQFFAQVHHITRDAGLAPYQPDVVPELEFSPEGLTIGAKGTENIALPCGAPQFLGRTIRKLHPIQVAQGTAISKLHEKIASVPALSSFTYQHLDDTVQGVDKIPALSEMATGIIYDDCESTAGLARVVKKSGLLIPTDPKLLSRLCGSAPVPAVKGTSHLLEDQCHGWPLFNSFTPRCWEMLASIFERGNQMLESGQLRVMTAVGLATTASAADIKSESATFNGHCFNVGIIHTETMERPYCFLLEGTAPMIQLKVTESSPRVTFNIFNDPANSTHYETQTHDMPAFLTLLGRSLSAMTQVINTPNGGHYPKGGWPTKDPITGWLASVMVMNSLDSDPNTELKFYNRVMYMGWPCTETGQGCMPVEEPGTAACLAETLSGSNGSGLVAGCHPFSLNNLDIRGFDAGIPPAKVHQMSEIMNEATPPIASHKIFQQLATFWVPCTPLEDTNVREQAMREKGVEYVRVGAMETPSIPEYISIIYEAKRQLINRANQINMAHTNSDGIIGSVMALGTGVHVFLDVPQRDIHQLTYIESLRQAMEDIKWPGFTKSGSEKK